MRRLAERAPELAAEMSTREPGLGREIGNPKRLGVASVDQVSRPQEMALGRDEPHGPSIAAQTSLSGDGSHVRRGPQPTRRRPRSCAHQLLASAPKERREKATRRPGAVATFDVVALKRLVQGLVVAVAAAAIVVVPAMSVSGGTVIQVQASPWTVFVQQVAGSARFLCTGSIVDPSHILTAAHCLYDEAGTQAQPAQLSIKAGVSNFTTPLSTDLEQDRAVTSFRIHPGYVWSSKPTPDDVAVLALPVPLDVGGAAVQTVALPSSGMAYPTGAAVGLAGFGRQNPTISSSGPLDWMTATVDAQGACGSNGGLIDNNAILVCASSPSSAVCSGDSGSGLVTTAGSPVLIGVVSAGSSSCGSGTHGLFTYTGAPEILQFIQGVNTPPTAPRSNDSTALDIRWDPPLVVGNTLSCTTSGWVGQAQFTYMFVSSATGDVLQSGPGAKYVIPASAVGDRVMCEVAASNSGGTALEETEATSAIKGAPQVRIAKLAPVLASPGGHVTVHVTLVSPVGLWGRFNVCVTLPARAGGHLCRSAKNADGSAGTFPFDFTFKIRPTAPVGSAKIAIAATAGLSSANATALLRISR